MRPIVGSFAVALTTTVLIAGCAHDSTNRATGETDCSARSFDNVVGESVSFFKCVGDWAVLQPSSYVNSCNDCESVWLYQWTGDDWHLRAQCNQYAVLSPGSCQPREGNLSNPSSPVELASWPPLDVRCALWDADTWTENLDESGCPPMSGE